MEKTKRLEQIIRLATDDEDAVGMILSANSEMANHDGLLLSGNQFDETAEMILAYFLTRQPPNNLEKIQKNVNIIQTRLHTLQGDCPDNNNGALSRDEDCPVCKALMEINWTS